MCHCAVILTFRVFLFHKTFPACFIPRTVLNPAIHGQEDSLVDWLNNVISHIGLSRPRDPNAVAFDNPAWTEEMEGVARHLSLGRSVRALRHINGVLSKMCATIIKARRSCCGRPPSIKNHRKNARHLHTTKPSQHTTTLSWCFNRSSNVRSARTWWHDTFVCLFRDACSSGVFPVFFA